MAGKRPKNSGKAPSIQFYYKDFLTDMQEHDPEVVGAWMLILCKIWHSNSNGALTRTLPQWAKIIHTDEENARRLICEECVNLGDVTRDSNGKITITNRRTARDAKLKEQNRLRQERYRQQQQSNADVADEKPNPSTSSSSSTAVNIYTHTHIAPTLNEVLAVAPLLGIPDDKAKAWYEHYQPQGFVFGNGLPITDLHGALVRWRNNQYKFDRRKTNGSFSSRDDTRTSARDFGRQQSEFGETIDV